MAFSYSHVRAAVAALSLSLLAANASAATTFSLDKAQAAPGETVEIHAVYINDSNAAASWTPARQLVLQWRSTSGEVIRSLAHLSGDAVPATVPVNNFARMSWRAVVPPGVSGLQAVAVEGEPTLMALDTSPLEAGPIAGTPAATPIVDAGVPGESVGTGAPLPETATAGLGVESSVGISPNAAQTAANVSHSTAAWEHVRNALSPHEPVYFVVGTREGTNARFQISLKYRFFQPPRNQAPSFHENLYLGYTQTSLWDLDSPSKPFYDTTYNPSVFWQSDSLWASPAKRWSLGMASGVDHRSNGQSGDESRSLNSFFVQPALNYRFAGGSTLSLAPKVRSYFSVANENSDYSDYAGHVDWQLKWAQDDGMMLAGMLRQGDGGRRTVQVDLAWPLRHTWLSNMNGYLHMQYFNGYGETLRNYNERHKSQFRVGLMLIH